MLSNHNIGFRSRILPEIPNSQSRGLGMVGLALRTTKQCYPTIILGFGVVYCPKSPILKVRDLTQIWHRFDTHFAHLWDLGFGRGRGLGMVGLALRTTKQCYPTIILGFGVLYCPKSPILKVRDLTQIWHKFDTHFAHLWDLGFGRGRGLGMVGLALRTTKQCYPTIILGFGVVYCPKSPILKVRDLTQIWHKFCAFMRFGIWAWSRVGDGWFGTQNH